METYIDGAKEMTYTEEAEPINPDEVRLRINSVIEDRLAQSWADLNINDRAEYLMKPEEVWDEGDLNDDAEMGIVEHFPEGENYGKPKEVWPDAEDFLDEEEDDDFMREYSPEPRVVYNDGTEDVKDEDVNDGDVDDERAKDDAKVLRDSRNEEKSVKDSPIKENTKEGSLSGDNLPSAEENSDKPSTADKEIYEDPNLGYDIKDNSNMNLPNLKPTDADTESKTVEKEKVDFTKNGLTNRKKRRPLSKDLNETSQESGANFTLGRNNMEEVESVSALEKLRIVAKEQDLLPSGPPRFGPSINGKKEVEGEAPEEVPSYVPSLDGVKLYMNAGMLNGTSRMAADNIASQLECDNLLKLMEVRKY